MAKNFLDYTKLDYTKIVEQITAKLASDSRFENFRESAIAQMVTEIFAGTTDLTNYYIERRAEESYLETAKLRSSAIQLSKQLGYVVTRPIPAVSTLAMVIKGGGTLGSILSAVATGSVNVIQLPIYKSYTFKGTKFILKNTYKYIFTEDDIINFQSSTYSKTITLGLSNSEELYNVYKDEDLVNESDTVTMEIFQGELKTADFIGAENEQLDKKFQIYKIEDATFSNIYGDEDYDINVTRVCVNNDAENPYTTSSTVSATNTYEIDRRSLIQTGTLLTDFDNAQDICLMRTSPDEQIELLFGDDNYASVGAKDGEKSNVYVQYLSTLGANANVVGVVGDKIQSDESIYLNNDPSKNISSNLTFTLNTNITQGANIESVDSIKTLASSIYYALDRLVTKDDYIAYLKSLTSPINVKNAYAWGEQEEGAGEPIKKLFNVVLFTAFGELYKYDADSNVWDVKQSDTSCEGDMNDAVLDDVDIFTEYPDHYYYELLVKEDSPGISRDLETASLADSGSKLKSLYTNLNKKHQMTVRNVYVSPIIHEFAISGSVYIDNMSDATAMTTKIKNAVYGFLNERADFKSSVYLSNIIELVEDFDGIAHANIDLYPLETTGFVYGAATGSQTMNLATMGDDDALAWALAYDNWLSPASTVLPLAEAMQTGYDTISVINGTDWGDLKSNADLSNKSFITESWFQKTFLPALAEATEDIGTTPAPNPPGVPLPFKDSTYWKNIVVKLHNSLSYIIKYNVMVSGSKTRNIVSYTLPNELSKVTFNANVFYNS